MLFLMDIQDLEQTAFCTNASCMPARAPNYPSGSFLVLEQPRSPQPPKSPLQATNGQLTTTTHTHFGRQNSHNTGRPLTSSPFKNTKGNSNIENNGAQRVQQFRQGKHRSFNSSTSSSANNSNQTSPKVYRRNNTVLTRFMVHPKQQQSVSGCDPSAKISNEPSHNGNSSNPISKSTCDINGGVGGNKSNTSVHNSTPKRGFLNLNHVVGSSNKRNSRVDLPFNFKRKNYRRSNSFGEDNSRPKKTRRSRRRKRPYEAANEQHQPDKRMRWTECNADEVSRLHRNCMQKGQPLAPYNTTQFIMNEHNAEKEIDFDELSGQIQQMHNNRKPLDNSGDGAAASSDLDESNRDDYYYSSPEDESYFLEQQFHEAYDTMHAERLNSMSKGDLLKEYLLIEKELETLRQKSPNGEGGPIKAISVATKSPRPPSMPASPRGQLGLHLQASRHHPYLGGASCSNHRGLIKENKHLRKLLKQVYSRYNSLLYCISYVNSTNANSSGSSSSSATAGEGGHLDETSHGVDSLSTNSHHHHQHQSPVIADDFQLTNEMHYRIEKYISHPSPSPLLNYSSTSSSSTSYTSSGSSSSESASTSISSEDDGDVEEHRSYNSGPRGGGHGPEQAVREVLSRLVALVVEGN